MVGKPSLVPSPSPAPVYLLQTIKNWSQGRSGNEKNMKSGTRNVIKDNDTVGREVAEDFQLLGTLKFQRGIG